MSTTVDACRPKLGKHRKRGDMSDFPDMSLALTNHLGLDSQQRNAAGKSGRATQFTQCLELELILAGP